MKRIPKRLLVPIGIVIHGVVSADCPWVTSDRYFSGTGFTASNIPHGSNSWELYASYVHTVSINADVGDGWICCTCSDYVDTLVNENGTNLQAGGFWGNGPFQEADSNVLPTIGANYASAWAIDHL